MVDLSTKDLKDKEGLFQLELPIKKPLQYKSELNPLIDYCEKGRHFPTFNKQERRYWQSFVPTASALRKAPY